MLFLAVLVAGVVALDPIVKLNISTNSTGPTVASNFLGISFELSFLDQYCELTRTSVPEGFSDDLTQLAMTPIRSPTRGFRI